MGKPPADLRVYWSKRERTLIYDGSKPTGGMLSTIFETTAMQMHYITLIGERYTNAMRDDTTAERMRTLAQELDARGYDLTTLRFSIRKKPPIADGTKEG